VFSLSAIVLRSPLPPTCLVLTAKEARSYFASTIRVPTVTLDDTTCYYSTRDHVTSMRISVTT
jgi:hypothetical protein